MSKKVPPTDQGLLFGDRFLETFAGTRLLKEPRFAIAELIANASDAGATRVGSPPMDKDPAKDKSAKKIMPASKDNPEGSVEVKPVPTEKPK